MAKREKNQDLPGMEDRKIKALEDVGIEYAEIRDARIALNKREVKLKASVRTLMHKHGKTVYISQDVDIELLPPDQEEEVKVKLKKPKITVADSDDVQD